MSRGARPGSPLGGRAAQAGVTLTELLVTMAVTGLVAAGLYGFFMTTSQTYTDQAVIARMLQNATTAMSRISQDIRMAGTFWSTPCALEPLVSATNGPPGRIEIRQMLDDPAVRIEVAPLPPAGQSQTSAVLQVVSTTGFQARDTAFITDGVQCTRFTVTQVVGGGPPGLQHNPAADLNSPGGPGYLYPAETSLVYRVATNRRVIYSIDTSDPATPWLTRDTGTGPRRLVPDIESLRFSYVMNTGPIISDPATVTTAAQAAMIRVVHVSVTSRADRPNRLVGGDGLRRQTLGSDVQLRNLGQ
jgi:prepilin-type N-terminal cleavage/methylation domain-containing protein